MKRIRVQFPVILIITLTLLSGDDYGSISTSRPGMANPTSSVPYGLYQFELGTNLDTGPKQDTTVTLPILIRMGVYRNTELLAGYANQYLTLGVLYGGIQLFDGLENSVILTTSMIENDDDLTEYLIYLPVTYSFHNGYSVWGQFSETFFRNADLDPMINYSLAMGNNLNERSSWFIEMFQSYNSGEDFQLTEKPILINSGITYLAENNLQFDISMGINFQIESVEIIEHSRFLEWGFSFRLPE